MFSCSCLLTGSMILKPCLQCLLLNVIVYGCCDVDPDLERPASSPPYLPEKPQCTPTFSHALPPSNKYWRPKLRHEQRLSGSAARPLTSVAMRNRPSRPHPPSARPSPSSSIPSFRTFPTLVVLPAQQVKLRHAHDCCLPRRILHLVKTITPLGFLQDSRRAMGIR